MRSRVSRQAESGTRGRRPRAPLFQGASRPAAAVRKGRCAWPPRRLPSTPLRTGLPPRCIRHWRRSAPAVRKGRWASPPRRLPSTSLLTGLPPRFFRHWRRSAPAVRKGRWASPPRRLPSTSLLTGLPPRFFRHWRRSAPPPLRRVFHQRQKDPKKRLPQTKRAAPDERRASIIRRKTGKVFQLVFPRFFKSGWGSGGKAPGKIQRYPQRPYAVSISKAASRRHTQNTSRAASSSATGGRLGAMRILLSWGSLP